jgi:hypothetical protein
MAALVPDSWHFKLEDREDLGFGGFYVTQEDIDEVGRFTTGLSVWVFEDVPEAEEFSLELLDINVSAETTLRYKGPWDTQAGELVIHHLEIEAEFPYETEVNQFKTIHYLAIPYKGTVYYAIFESPTAEWDDAIKDFGVPLMNYLVILNP